MSTFIYKAKKPSGETYEASRNANDRYELYRLIRENGDDLVSLTEKPEGKGMHREITLGGLGQHVNIVEKINFSRNLGSMLEAGLALSRALSVLERQTKNKALKKVVTTLITDVTKGDTFATALAKHPKVFSTVFVAMVHAGEQSGTLAQALKVVAQQMDTTHSLERKVRGALMYPSVIICAMVIIGVLMMTYVVPTLLKTFTDLHVQLPLATQVIVVTSNILQNYGLFVFAGAIIIGAGAWYWHKTPQGKNILHAIVLKIPVIGNLIQEVNAARTARTLSSLLSSGVDVVESVSITALVVQNVHFRAVLEKAALAIKKGELMSKVFEDKGKLYPIFFSEMMSVGEETGKTGEMLANVAKYYEEDVDQKTKDMSTIIEPMLMVIIGAAVGFFAVSMIQPIYSLVNVI